MISHGEGGKGIGTTVVEKVGCSVGDSRATRLEEGIRDHVAEDKAFGIDGLRGDGNMGGEDVKK